MRRELEAAKKLHKLPRSSRRLGTKTQINRHRRPRRRRVARLQQKTLRRQNPPRSPHQPHLSPLHPQRPRNPPIEPTRPVHGKPADKDTSHLAQMTLEAAAESDAAVLAEAHEEAGEVLEEEHHQDLRKVRDRLNRRQLLLYRHLGSGRSLGYETTRLRALVAWVVG